MRVTVAPTRLTGMSDLTQTPHNQQLQPAHEPGRRLLDEFSSFTVATIRLPAAFLPLVQLVSNDEDITQAQLAAALDRTFDGLYRHPVTRYAEWITQYLRVRRLIPNENSTENLIRFVVDQTVQRSPVQIPEPLINEFWEFFDELMRSPELKGLGELSLDMLRMVLRTYEPLLVEIINLMKAGKRFNQWQVSELLRRAQVVRQDVAIIRRQLRALRYIRPFFQADPQDFGEQAEIAASMVREFGPFFVKMAQAAAANADFLPEEIARELAVFHEDVPPMNAEEVVEAFRESYGAHPNEIYADFNAEKPLRSGSIGSVYIGKRSFQMGNREMLVPVLIKVGRHNIDREFAIGKLVLGLAIMSSQYWAPHSKLTPFLQAWHDQVDEFTKGFREEIDFSSEAANHVRFYNRSQGSSEWSVPALYGVSRRVLEMEFVDAQSLPQAKRAVPRWRRRLWQRRTSERLLYSLLYQLLIYGECHGDLHPGNIMVGKRGQLYLIDWGNAVDLTGMGGIVWRYLSSVLMADTDTLADALIEISTDPAANRERRSEIKAALDDTLRKKGITRLGGITTPLKVLREGGKGVHQRLQTALHLLSNTQQLGIVPRGEYMHLMRSALAAAGAFGTIYEDTGRLTVAGDLATFVGRFPLRMAGDRARVQWRHARGRAWQSLPFHDALQFPEPPVITNFVLEHEHEAEFPYLPQPRSQ